MNDLELRDYQAKAYTSCREKWSQGAQAVCLVSPTASGKSLMGNAIARTFREPLWVVHRRELRDQAPPGMRAVTIQGLVASGQRPSCDMMVVDECFVAGTMIGETPIERVQAGQLVRSYDERTGSLVNRRVIRKFVSRPQALIRVHIGNRVLICTPNHPFLTARGWVAARHLEPTDNVLRGDDQTDDREMLTLDSIEILERGSDGRFGGLCPDGLVYNLEVEQTHTYLANGVVVHNCHHLAADEWRQVANDYRHVPVLGLTATPQRGDGRPLGDIFQQMVVAVQYSELLDRGFIVPCRIVRPERKIDGVAQEPVEVFCKYARDTQAFAFCQSVSAARELAEKFNAIGISAMHISAQTPKDERDAAVAEFRAGRLRILANYNILTEGVNIPAAQTVILARGVSHVGAYMQIAGRILRASEGKEESILLDLPGVSHLDGFGFPTDDREYSLDGVPMRSADTELKTCPECQSAVHNSETICPHCEHRFPEPEKSQRGGGEDTSKPHVYNLALRTVYAGDETPDAAKQSEWERLEAFAEQKDWSLSWALKEWKKLFPESPKPAVSEEAQFKELARLLAHAQAKGYKRGWVGYRFKDMFGGWPSRQWYERAATQAAELEAKQRAELKCASCGGVAQLQWHTYRDDRKMIRRTCTSCSRVDFAPQNSHTRIAADMAPPFEQSTFDDLPF